jgi:ribosomal protein S18 acetylase RimI-like enzyme
MAITEARAKPSLPMVRRLEAVGFRAWPAASVQYDGSWQVRLNGGHPSKRVNSVVPLDPQDNRNIAVRVEKAGRKFQSYGRTLTIRQTPLAPPELIAYLEDNGWASQDETLVMTVGLDDLDLGETMDHLPTRDVGRFVDASLSIEGQDVDMKPALAEIITSIKPDAGLFVTEVPDLGPVAAMLCVHDNDLAGIMQFAVAENQRRKGTGSEILAAGLRWARVKGARTAWLQVDAGNLPALGLYRKFGFQEAYRYSYWRAKNA